MFSFSKYLTFFLLISFSTIGVASEDEEKEKVGTGPYVFERIEDVNLSKKEIIAYAGSYIAEKFVSAKSVIELKDPDLGKIVGNIVLKDPESSSWGAFHGIHARLVLDAKEGKYRLKISNVVATDSKGNDASWGKLESANRYRIEPMAKRILNTFATDMSAYLKNTKKDANW